MRAKIVRIGNSQGIRIPKGLLEQCRLGKDVELEVEDGQLVIRSAREPRQGWEKLFAGMTEAGDDVLLDDAVATQSFETE